MAITTLDQVATQQLPPEDFIKGSFTPEAIFIWHSLFYTPGAPGAAIAPAPGLSGAALTSYAGQIPFTNPTGGNLSYLSRLVGIPSNSGQLRIMDRLWHNSGLVVTTTTAQTVNSVAWPARDRNGSTSGVGVLIALEVSTATTNAASITNCTISYTNSAGTAGRTGTIDFINATSTAGALYFFRLQAGDIGVQSVQSCTLGTSLVTGVVHLVAVRTVMTMAGSATGAVPNELNPITGGMPRLWDNSVLFGSYIATAAGGTTIFGSVTIAQG